MRIDVNGIEGYAEMTPEEKIAALEGYEFAEADNKEKPKPETAKSNSEIERLKAALSRANSEAAESKRQLKARMSAEEQEAAEREERDRKLQEELEQLRKEKTVSGFTAKYLKLGYDEELAVATATAMADGDTDTVFANQAAFIESQKTKYATDSLNKQPGLTAGKYSSP